MKVFLISTMKLILLALFVTIVASSEIDRPSPQAVNPSVCVNKIGEKPGDKCACKVWIKGKTNPPEYYLKWTCPNQDPNKPVPTAPTSMGMKAAVVSTTPKSSAINSTPKAVKKN